MNPILTSPNKCPTCDRENFIHVRNLEGQRSGNNLRLYLCKNCHSLFTEKAACLTYNVTIDYEKKTSCCVDELLQ